MIGFSVCGTTTMPRRVDDVRTMVWKIRLKAAIGLTQRLLPPSLRARTSGERKTGTGHSSFTHGLIHEIRMSWAGKRTVRGGIAFARSARKAWKDLLRSRQSAAPGHLR